MQANSNSKAECMTSGPGLLIGRMNGKPIMLGKCGSKTGLVGMTASFTSLARLAKYAARNAITGTANVAVAIAKRNGVDLGYANAAQPLSKQLPLVSPIVLNAKENQGDCIGACMDHISEGAKPTAAISTKT